MEGIDPRATSVAVSQPMYFPWVGLFEQLQLVDVFIHYCDVQYARGFFNRVQVKTAQGTRWLTVPLRGLHRGQLINQVKIDNRVDWKSQHREILRQSYRKTPFLNDLLALFDDVVAPPVHNLADLSVASVIALADYFDLPNSQTFCDSSNMGVSGRSSQRLLDLTLAVGGNVYVTGHGAVNYLDHQLFETAGVEVRYMNYELRPYPQLHGPFTPYVTALDLVANCGRDGRNFIGSSTIYWREFTQ